MAEEEVSGSNDQGTITEKYLLWVVANYGKGQEIMSTNCAGFPVCRGDYAIKYGKAGELLQRVRGGDILRWP